MHIRARRTIKLTEEKVKQYALLSGDHNPIHLDPKEAERHGFKQPIAHGMLVMAMGAELFASASDEKFAFSQYEMKFLKPVYVNEAIELIIKQSADSEWMIIQGYAGEELMVKGKIR